MTSELWRASALELAALIRSGAVSSREVVDAHLDRIEQVNPQLNAVVRVLADEARAAADEADRAIASGGASGGGPSARLGVLHGVPITVKENIDVAGTPTTNAVPALAGAIASIDAPIVQRMRRAGAIPIARTNLPDFGLRVHTDSALHGLTKNPWSPLVTVGGSSGGEGSAIASGMSPLGLGNDIGGSLRNPAHCCGISSIKPTTGVIASATVIPPAEQSSSSQLMAVEGIMARRMADIRAALLAVAGMDSRDPISLPVTLIDSPQDRPLRIAVIADPPGGAPTDAGISSAVRRAAATLADRGHTVVDAVPATYERAIELWRLLLMGDIRTIRATLDTVMGADGKQFLDFADSDSPPIDLATWTIVHTERNGVAADWAGFFTEYDAIVSPVWTQPAFQHGADIADLEGALATMEMLRPVLPMNLLGLPSAVTPAGLSNGMPVGVQVTGDRFHDLACISIAAEIEDSLGILTPIDPVT